MQMNNLLRAYLAAICFIYAGSAIANSCIANDSWTGRDKVMHFKAGVLISTAVTLTSNNPSYGLIAGTSAGLIAELKDLRRGRVCSLQDFVVTTIGAAAGAHFAGLVILPQKKGLVIAYSTKF